MADMSGVFSNAYFYRDYIKDDSWVSDVLA
jgi:hypothetical protein